MNSKLRIATLGIHHETNTFASNKTTLASFNQSGLQTYAVQRGQQYADMHGHAQTSMAGYMRGAVEHGFELVPLLFAATDPAGTISSEAFETLGGEALGMLRKQCPFDGVLLNQMGAAVSEEFPDMDGEIARRAREIVGPNVPVVMTLDLHANVSQQMAEQTDALVVYRTNPHTDAVPRALDACDLVVRMASGDWRPAKWLEQPPMVIGIFQHDTRDMPMKAVIDDLETGLARPGVGGGSVARGCLRLSLRWQARVVPGRTGGSARAGPEKWLIGPDIFRPWFAQWCIPLNGLDQTGPVSRHPRHRSRRGDSRWKAPSWGFPTHVSSSRTASGMSRYGVSLLKTVKTQVRPTPK